MGEIMFKPKIWSMLSTDPIQTIALNLCIWHDGTLHPAKGHKGNCKWLYDGQVFYHAPIKKGKHNDNKPQDDSFNK